MNAKHLVAAAAATILMGGAAYAQERGETPNQPAPANPTQSQTGVPSVDSTRPTGANAGATNLPQGEVSGDASATVSGPAHTDHHATTGAPSAEANTSTAASASAATSLGASASATTQMVTNGPVPDTPENRRKYGQPLSRAGKMTAPVGN